MDRENRSAPLLEWPHEGRRRHEEGEKKTTVAD